MSYAWNLLMRLALPGDANEVLMEVPKNSAKDLPALESAFLFSTLTVFLTAVAFSILRQAYPDVYAHRAKLYEETNEAASASPGYTPHISRSSSFNSISTLGLNGGANGINGASNGATNGATNGVSGGSGLASPVSPTKRTGPPSETGPLLAQSSGFFGWLPAVWSVTDDQIIAAAGLDGFMLIEYCRLVQLLLLLVGTATVGLLCPLHYFNGEAYEDKLSRLGVGPLLKHKASPSLLWIHAGTVWFVVLVSLKLLFMAQRRFLERRFKWLSEMPLPRATTLLVENIPAPCRSDEALRDYFARVFSVDVVEAAYVVRRTSKLCALRKRKAEVQYAFLVAQAKWDRAGRRPGKRPMVHSLAGSQDAIELHRLQLRELRARIAEERCRVEAGVTVMDNEVCSEAGFVTFTSRQWCRLALQERYCANASEFVVSMPPDPGDVLYENLAQPMAIRQTGGLLCWLSLIAIFCLWMPVVFSIASATKLSALRKHVVLVEMVCHQFPTVHSFLEGVLATAALNFFMAMMPSFLMFVVRRFLSVESGGKAQLKLQGWYFSFQVIFVLLVTTIGRSFILRVEQIVKDWTSIFELLAQTLPDASHFYLNYFVFGWVTACLELLRAANLAKYLAFRAVTTPEEAREWSEPENQDSYGIGARMASVALMASTALVYCTCSPVITIVAWVYFTLCRLVYTYLLVFAETKKPDQGGHPWVVALNHTLVGLAIFVVLAVGVLFKRAGASYPALATCPALLAIWVGHRRLENMVWRTLPFEAVAKADHVARAKSKDSGQEPARVGQYAQPELMWSPDESPARQRQYVSRRRRTM